MADYLHGAYGQIQAVASRMAEGGESAIVYIGTAPVHTVEGGANNVNKPVLVNNIAEARKYFGYSEDFASFTLCEAMKVHLIDKGVGPLVLINVFDPTKHKETTGGTTSKTPENGVITIPSAALIYLDSVVVGSKVKGTDYSIAYNAAKETIVITELTSGSLGTDSLTITYDIAKPESVTEADVIGSTDGAGLNTGLYAVKDVYSLVGIVPAYIVCPGFSSIPDVHTVLEQISKKINGHWDAWLFTDLPITNDGTAITLNNVKTFKDANGFKNENETVSFPLVEGIDGFKYHLSVLRAANFQELLLETDGIPYKTASNTDIANVKNLYLGASDTGRVYDDSIINEKLNKNGIASAAYVGGRWAIWGAHAADYDQDNADYINVAETNRMMLFYVSNDFQARRMLDVDTPMTRNDLLAIVAEEQARLDALKNIGAILYGEVALDAEGISGSDVMNGDFSFTFNITTTPLAKSLTAQVNWTDAGFVTYFETEE